MPEALAALEAWHNAEPARRYYSIDRTRILLPRPIRSGWMVSLDVLGVGLFTGRGDSLPEAVAMALSAHSEAQGTAHA